MPKLEENTLTVMGVLEHHPALDVLQISSRAELPVSATVAALQELGLHGLLKDHGGVFSLNAKTLGELLETA